MPITFKPPTRSEELKDLLRRDRTLNGAVLIGIEGQPIEIQARAMEVYDEPISWAGSTRITGMARGAISEVLSRITGAFTKLEVPNPQAEILINLAPADLLKEGTWLDLPIAIIMLQAAGILPDLPDHKEGDFILAGEIGIHGEIRRIPGALSLAYLTRPGQNLIVPYGNEMECALISKKPGHEGSRVHGAATLEEVIEFFQGKRKLTPQSREGFKFQDVIPKHLDFGRIKGQTRAKRAAVISAAGGHNLLM